jgi:hypothetical protein
LTDKTYNQFFKLINRKSMYVNLAWDRDRHGCFIFVTPVISGTATHLYFDARNGGFWPMQYPDSHGPVSCCVYDGDDPTDRYLLMGGRTGLVQIQSDVDRTDNGTKITSYVLMGPYQLFGPTMDGIVTNLDMTAGEVFTGDATSDWNMNWTVKGGRTAYEVTEGTQRTIAAGNLAIAGWQSTRVQRIRGSFHTLKLSNSNSGDYFSIESVNLTAIPGGKLR